MKPQWPTGTSTLTRFPILYEGTKEQVQAQALAYVAEGGRTGYVLSADCSLKPDVNYERIRWVGEALDSIA